jgi:hypothetical protein
VHRSSSRPTNLSSSGPLSQRPRDLRTKGSRINAVLSFVTWLLVWLRRSPSRRRTECRGIKVYGGQRLIFTSRCLTKRFRLGLNRESHTTRGQKSIELWQKAPRRLESADPEKRAGDGRRLYDGLLRRLAERLASNCR